MEDYQYYYEYYRGKYYECCGEINHCDNLISDYNARRRTVVNRINDLKSEIRKYENTIEKLDGIIGCEEDINTKLTTINNKMSEASVNYTGMVSSSGVSNKVLTDVFEDETTQTKTAVSNAFQTVRTRRSNLETQIADKRSELISAENEKNDLDIKLSRTKGEREEWRRQKTSNWYNMEYYKRKMKQQEGY